MRCVRVHTYTHTDRMRSRVLFHQNKKSELKVIASTHFIGGGGVLFIILQCSTVSYYYSYRYTPGLYCHCVVGVAW
jgi:azurin